MTHSTAAMTNHALDQSRDTGLLDTTHHLTGSALDKSRLLDISSVDASQEESKSAIEISEFEKGFNDYVNQELPVISHVDEYKQAGYSAMIDTLQIYDQPSDGIKPLDLESDVLGGIDALNIEEVQMSKQELAQIKEAAWTPIHDSLKIYDEYG